MNNLDLPIVKDNGNDFNPNFGMIEEQKIQSNPFGNIAEALTMVSKNNTENGPRQSSITLQNSIQNYKNELAGLGNSSILENMVNNGIGNSSPEARYGMSVQDKRVNGKMFNSATGLSGNKAFRNNNPGNITGMSGKLLYGAQGIAHSKTGDKGDQRQLFFATPEDGTRAMYKLMRSDRYNNAPIAQAFSKWQTNKKAWEGIKNEYRSRGIDVDKQRFVDLTPEQQYNFMNIRARHEGFSRDIPNIFG